ncbi:DNA-binding FadR family transcriptional regulator [Paraburkholderia unamae]|uniref:FadR/GntR family transcriptional regulator n=1 Tax=Paraburkholderia unamae TaxID=219649 RepID=UPI000DC24004|nr:FadR/GntR family transcriptional regulator [Paraburkholderia unamae]RAR53340.1 DNA-binding FadR family transcriptional regulator [Paraburkholderia unamae]
MTSRIPAYRQAQMEIKSYIERHGLRFGDALPSEGQLAQDLGMSRPSLREAMKSLESLGVVESRHGEGIYVKAFSFDSIIDNLPYAFIAEGHSLRELLQVRAAIEIGAVPEIHARIPAADVARLRVLAQQMLARAEAHELYEEQDREFHATLHQCLDNPFLSRLIDLFWQVFRRLNHSTGQPEHWLIEATARDHIDIVDRLEAGDLGGLVKAYRKHFDTIFARMDAEAAGA